MSAERFECNETKVFCYPQTAPLTNGLKAGARLQGSELQVKRSLTTDSLAEFFDPLQKAHESFASVYPGPRGDRQPVHTVYGGAHLFRADTAKRLGEKALSSLNEYAPDFATFAKAIELPGVENFDFSQDSVAALAEHIEKDPNAARKKNFPAWFAYTLYQRVLEKLKREAVEDFRIDFEDGFGNRPDEEEDRYAAEAAAELAKGMEAGIAAAFHRTTYQAVQ